MKKVINEKLIKRNKLIGNITSVGGIAILAAGLILNFNPTPLRTMISFAALIIGFIVAQISTHYVNRFARSPRFDEVIADNLSKLNNDYTFFAYSGLVPMILVGPSGMWVPVPVSASGEITYDKKWRQKGGSFLLRFFGQENIGNPDVEASANVRRINELLAQKLDEQEIPPVHSILVSLNPKAVIENIENAPVPMVQVNALRRHIRKVDRKMEEEISKETLQKINSIFGG
jgi:energy-converting hydrogenase Eha subunit C